MKKIICVLLAVMMLLSMSVGAMAATIPAHGSIWTPSGGGNGGSGGGGGGSRPVIEPEEAEDEDCPQDETCPIAEFEDSDPKAWYHDGVHYALEENLMKGINDTEFQPEATATRAMIVTILWRLEGQPYGGSTSFTDVIDGAWYEDAVAWAAGSDIVTGYANNTFGPMDPITREQMAAILYRYAEYKGMDVSASTGLGSFSDAASVGAWAEKAVKWACAEGLINGIGGKLVPQGNASRAEVATILFRFIEK